MYLSESEKSDSLSKLAVHNQESTCPYETASWLKVILTVPQTLSIKLNGDAWQY